MAKKTKNTSASPKNQSSDSAKKSASKTPKSEPEKAKKKSASSAPAGKDTQPKTDEQGVQDVSLDATPVDDDDAQPSAKKSKKGTAKKAAASAPEKANDDAPKDDVDDADDADKVDDTDEDDDADDADDADKVDDTDEDDEDAQAAAADDGDESDLDDDEDEDEEEEDEDLEDEEEDEEEDEDEEDEDLEDEEEDEEEEVAPPKPAKKNQRQAPKAAPAAAKGTAAKKKAEPTSPTDDLRVILGIADKPRDEDLDDYRPHRREHFPIGRFFLLLLVFAGLIVGAVFASKALEKRQTELDEKARLAAEAAEAARIPTVRYGNLAIMNSIPEFAFIEQNGQPIYTKTASGMWTELRARPSTWINNVRVEEGTVLRFTLNSEGYKPYEIVLSEYDWSSVPATGDLEKIYNRLALEPIELPRFQNCAELAEFNPALYANLCSVNIPAEIQTRKDFERIYNQRLTGTITIRTDRADAKVFFLGEPLMIITPAGTQAHATAGRDGLTFSSFGKTESGEDKVINITDELSIRLEAEGSDPYLAEIFAHQWRCDPIVAPDVILARPIPTTIDPNAPPPYHHLCNYTYVIDVRFDRMKMPERGAASEN